MSSTPLPLTEDGAPGDSSRPALRSVLRGLAPRRISAVYLWLAFVVLFGLLRPETYLSSVTLQLIFSEGAVTCLLALAFLVPLAAGAYDLSIGALMSTSVVIGVWLQLHTVRAAGRRRAREHRRLHRVRRDLRASWS